MSALRVALVHSFYSARQPSGENAAVLSQAAALERAGHAVELIDAYTDTERERPGFLLRAGLAVATGNGRSPVEQLERFRPDVVYVHNLFPNFGRRWALQVEAPLVAVVHNYRPLCANGLLYRDGQVCTLCPDGQRWSGVRYACYRDSRLASLPLAYANRQGAAHDPLFEGAARIMVLSDLQRDVYLNAGVPADKLIVMPNFLPDGLDPGREQQEPAAERSGWMFVGRLSEEKGILDLLRRWPPGSHLRIAGDGPLEQRLHAEAAGKDIEFLGRQPREAVVKLMRQSCGVVFSSLWFEGFPLVYVEAMACATPVLALGPNVVGRLVGTDGTGRYLEWDDLAGALPALEREFPSLSARCRAVFEERYTEAAFHRRLGLLHAELGLAS